MIVALLWFLSFFLALPLIEPEEYARLGAVTCALLAAAWPLARGLAGDGVRLPGGAAALAAGLFWCAVAASILWSPAPYISIIAFFSFSLMPLAALGFLLLPVAERARALRAAAGLAGAALGALALWAIVQYAFLPDMLVHGQPRHPFANPNSYAALLALGVLPALASCLTARRFAARAAAAGLALLLVAGVMVIGGRAVPFVLLGALAVFVAMTFASWRTRAGAGTLAGGAVAAGVALAVLFSIGGDHGAIRVLRVLPDAATVAGRWPIWQAGWAMIRDHLWTGTGIGTFFLYYPAYRLPADTASGGYMMHNDPLQFWAETGIAGFILFYAFVAAALVRMARRWPSMAAGPDRTMTAALFCTLGAVVIHAHGDFDFYTGAILSLCGLGLAWWHTLTAADAAEPALRRPARLPGTAGYALGLLPVIGCVFLLQGLLLSERTADSARLMAMIGQVDKFAAAVNRADHMGFGLNARPYVMAATVPLGVLEAPDGGPAAAEREKLRLQAAGLLGRAEARNARLVAVPYYRARLALAAEGDYAAAERFLRQALALNPQHLPSRMMLADVLQHQKRPDESYAILKGGLDWPYRTHDPRDYYQLTAIRALQRDDKDIFTRVQALTAAAERRRSWEWPLPEFMPGAPDDSAP
jgi:O-antigen ligase